MVFTREKTLDAAELATYQRELGSARPPELKILAANGQYQVFEGPPVEHFKSVTSMSPLHYHKVLRLQEARRLMLSAITDASTASQRVGYLSASQFSREYSRFFGSAPTRDIAALRSDSRLSA
jgi:methylphosphotriester-DNA--protein-cysteine methyltransferase